MPSTMKGTVVFIATIALVSHNVHNATAQFDFGTPEKLAGPVNGPRLDFSPSISSDGLELYFESTRSGGDYATWVARRDTVSDDFGTPERVTDLDHPSISSDGLSLFANRGVG